MRETAENWGGGGGGGGGGEGARIGCMSRVNGEMEVDRGRPIWELLARPFLEHASEVWWAGGKATCNSLKTIQENIGRKLVGASRQLQGLR